MNQQKLIELCAKARGWHKEGHQLHGPFWVGVDRIIEQKLYNPPDDANQADDLLEYVAGGRNYGTAKSGGDWFTNIFDSPHNISSKARTSNLAKILCSLRASPEVTEAEINDAMEEKP